MDGWLAGVASRSGSVEMEVSAITMSEVPRVRQATRLWRNMVRRWMVAWPDRPAARLVAKDGERERVL